MSPVETIRELKPISQVRQQVFDLSSRIRAGLTSDVAPMRILRYCRKFLHSYLRHQFEVEEEVIFPILGLDDADVRKAMAEHRRLRRLIMEHKDAVVALSQLEEELEAHMRFEEQQLIARVAEVATVEQLAAIEQAYAGLPPASPEEDKDEDVFWE